MKKAVCIAVIAVIRNAHDETNKKNTSMKINQEWHEKNKMPKNATFEQRVKWHLEHLKNCSCREGLPKKLAEEMKRRNILSLADLEKD